MANQPIELPIYGNWCGLNLPLDKSKAPAPIDTLDASCMRHDYCYAEHGRYSCECDKVLNDEIKAALTANKYLPAQRDYARTIHFYFATSPCNGSAETKIAPSRLLHNLYHKPNALSAASLKN